MFEENSVRGCTKSVCGHRKSTCVCCSQQEASSGDIWALLGERELCMSLSQRVKAGLRCQNYSTTWNSCIISHTGSIRKHIVEDERLDGHFFCSWATFLSKEATGIREKWYNSYSVLKALLSGKRQKQRNWGKHWAEFLPHTNCWWRGLWIIGTGDTDSGKKIFWFIS